ncbi:hypothetical protein VCHC44C1_3408B, partial [Vibrio cholerae HC-44C1]
CKFKDLDK